jgi:hypothetical protein
MEGRDLMKMEITWDMKKFATLLGFVLAVSGCDADGTPELCMDVDCSDGNECVQDGTCDPADGQCIPGANETDGTACDFSGVAGICDGAGTCEDAMLCEDVDCSDGNDCTEDVCDPADGSCSNPNETVDTVCDQDGGTVCDGDGNCVECNDDTVCDSGEICVDNECVSDDPNVLCDVGACVEGEALRQECVDEIDACLLLVLDIQREECILVALLTCNPE